MAKDVAAATTNTTAGTDAEEDQGGASGSSTWRMIFATCHPYTARAALDRVLLDAVDRDVGVGQDWRHRRHD